MCHKMTDHWREREHWLGRERGWHKKSRFGMVKVSVSFHGFGTQMLSGFCQQSLKQRTARILLLEKPFSLFTHPTMLCALGGRQKCFHVSNAYKQWGKMISVAPLVVLIVEKQEEIYSLIAFQRSLTEEGFG